METKYWSVTAATTTRTKDGYAKGSGESKRLYVGKSGSYQYRSHLKATEDWANVDKLVSAYLVGYTEDYDPFGSEMTLPRSTDTPKVYIRRNTSPFDDGTANDGDWTDGDYTHPSNTSSDAKSARVSPAALELVRIDITEFVEDWMATNVRRHDSGFGSNAANYGIVLYGTSATDENFALCSDKWPDAQYRPRIEINYELGRTTPDAPTNLTPSGSVTGLSDFQGDFTDLDSTDTMAESQVEVYGPGHSISSIGIDNVVHDTAHGLANGALIYFTSLTGGTGLSTFTPYYVVQKTTDTYKVSTTKGGTAVNVTVAYSAGTWRVRYYSKSLPVSNTEKTNGRFVHVPTVSLPRNVALSWRARVKDNEALWSAYSSLVTVTITNSAPTATLLEPANADSVATLDGVYFKGSLTDPENDKLLAYELQLSAYAAGDPNWDTPSLVNWNTGKVYVGADAEEWEREYGGGPLTSGTYYWRARVWDEYDNVSAWVTRQIVVSANFVSEVEDAPLSIQPRAHSPWRIVIKGMGASRGPGTVVAILENAKSVGASIMYNSPGEAHWTLPVDHPQISVIEPKQTHYSIQFYTGDGWREKFAGLVWDFDANERDVVFYGIDYLALYDFTMDERYDPANPDKPYTKGGSKYVDKTINQVITDHIDYVKALPNSPVGFITRGSIATMDEKVTLWTTFMPSLNLITGLLDSHKGGADRRTRVSVRPKSGGGYEIIVQDNPGVTRTNMRLRYGELVQGYRTIPFGNDWGTRMNVIGRTREGLKVYYERAKGPMDESVYGRFAKTTTVSDVDDRLDLRRRARQLAYSAGVLGNSLGLGLRSGLMGPRDGYDVTDKFPVSVQHGAVNTDNFGHSGLWVCLGIAWEAGDDGKQSTVLSLRPPLSGSAPSGSLLDSVPISPQAEWQIGWTGPDVVSPSSKYWLDQSTGKVYLKDGYGDTKSITGTA